MRIGIVVLAVAALAGCQTAGNDANIYGSPMGQRVDGNETYVTVSNVWNESDARPLAEKHCGQFGKAAKFTRNEGAKAVFDCVPR